MIAVSETRALPYVESDLVKQERVNVLSYALLHVLASVYLQPRAALRKIDALIAEKGSAAAFGALSADPLQFGEINPQNEDFFLPSPALHDALGFACYALQFRLQAMDSLPAAQHDPT